jgi:hypothetical protein
MKQLPIDLVYIVVPHQDGRGYSLREAGVVTVNLLGTDVDLQVMPEPEQRPIESAPLASAHEPSEVANQTHVDQMEMFPEFQFATPKSQAELLRERGLEQAPTQTKGGGAKKPRKARAQGRTASEDKISDDPNDTSWLEGLPAPTRAKGSVKINSIRTATPVEAEAASHFGRS